MCVCLCCVCPCVCVCVCVCVCIVHVVCVCVSPPLRCCASRCVAALWFCACLSYFRRVFVKSCSVCAALPYRACSCVAWLCVCVSFGSFGSRNSEVSPLLARLSRCVVCTVAHYSLYIMSFRILFFHRLLSPALACLRVSTDVSCVLTARVAGTSCRSAFCFTTVFCLPCQAAFQRRGCLSFLDCFLLFCRYFFLLFFMIIFSVMFSVFVSLSLSLFLSAIYPDVFSQCFLFYFSLTFTLVVRVARLILVVVFSLLSLLAISLCSVVHDVLYRIVFGCAL